MAAGVIVAVVVGGVVYLTRRAIARELLVGWLESRGVPADVQFREFEFGGFTARVRAGPEMDPDVSVERVEVRYGFTGFWSGEAPSVRVTSVKLYRPVVKGAFRNGKLKLGTLDPLIEEFTSRPPKPKGPQPRVEIHSGVVRLDTDYGLLKARADARLADGRLMAMDAQLDPAHFAHIVPGRNGMFLATVTENGRTRATWRRGARARSGIEVTPLPGETVTAEALAPRVEEWSAFHETDTLPLTIMAAAPMPPQPTPGA